jgi:hypothetical protein
MCGRERTLQLYGDQHPGRKAAGARG